MPARTYVESPTWASLLDQLRARFEALGGRWHVPASGEEMAAEIGALARPDTPAILVARDPEGVLDRLEIADRLTALGVPVVRSVAEAGDPNRIGVTVTTSGVAIADSGTFGMIVSSGQGRLASVIAPVHVAVLLRERVVPSLGGFLALAGEALAAGEASAVVLITGPSRTGDIEGQLVVGVHGPREIHCVVPPS